MNILAADVGGTKTLLALARSTPEGWRFTHRSRVVSRDHAAIEPLIQRWLNEVLPKSETLAGIGLGLAGPVTTQDGTVQARVTNLDWPVLKARDLSRHFGVPTVLINDFAAIGASLDALDAQDLLTLQPAPKDPTGMRLVVGAGTGLGTCLVGPPPVAPVYAGEGGHADFAPADAWQASLAQWVRAREGRCSREHLLSGAGIGRIARFLHEAAPDAALADALATADPAATIGALAEQDHPRALQVVTGFVRIYGGQIGDLALTALPRGGIFIAGGIAPRWRQHFEDPGFLQAVHAKAPMQDLLAGLPLHLIIHPEPGLLGAAVAAHAAVTASGETA